MKYDAESIDRHILTSEIQHTTASDNWSLEKIEQASQHQGRKQMLT